MSKVSTLSGLVSITFPAASGLLVKQSAPNFSKPELEQCMEGTFSKYHRLHDEKSGETFLLKDSEKEEMSDLKNTLKKLETAWNNSNKNQEYGFPFAEVKFDNSDFDALLNDQTHDSMKVFRQTKKSARRYRTIFKNYRCTLQNVLDGDHLVDGWRYKVAERWIKQIFGALEFLYSNKISLMYLTPRGILIDDNYNLKIADFEYAAKVDKKFATSTCHNGDIMIGKSYLAYDPKNHHMNRSYLNDYSRNIQKSNIRYHVSYLPKERKDRILYESDRPGAFMGWHSDLWSSLVTASQILGWFSLSEKFLNPKTNTLLLWDKILEKKNENGVFLRLHIEDLDKKSLMNDWDILKRKLENILENDSLKRIAENLKHIHVQLNEDRKKINKHKSLGWDTDILKNLDWYLSILNEKRNNSNWQANDCLEECRKTYEDMLSDARKFIIEGGTRPVIKSKH